MPGPDVPRGASARAPDYDRWLLGVGIALVVAASWGWLVYQDWAMRHMDVVDMAMPGRGPWGADDLVLIFTMWAVMMVAMMLPTAVPMLLAYRGTVAARRAGASAAALTGMFAAGYLAAWTAFSAAATLVHWGLHSAAAISPLMAITVPVVGGAVLVAAGLYQWTPVKRACLERCRSPLAFLLQEWRPGAAGAFSMGLRHGAYCIGCCALLMAVLFVVGAMNLLWVAALTALVLAEKALPKGPWLARASGLALVAWGAWVLHVAAA